MYGYGRRETLARVQSDALILASSNYLNSPGRLDVRPCVKSKRWHEFWKHHSQLALGGSKRYYQSSGRPNRLVT